MHTAIEHVALDRVDFNDHTFQVRTPGPVGPLARAIGQMGLLNEPFVRARGTCLQIVSGFHRMRACRDLAWETLPVKLLPSSTDTLGMVRLAITENVFHRPLDIVEQARCMGMLVGHCKLNQKALQAELNHLNQKKWWGMRNKLIAVDGLSPDLKAALGADIVGLPVALELAQWEDEAARGMVNLFRRLPMGLNRQRELVTWIKEIALRDKCTLARVIDDNRPRGSDDRQAGDRGVQTRRLRDRLFARRYPRRAKAQADFDAKASKAHLGPGIRLIPPANFEAHQYRMELGFQSRHELRKRVTQLQKAMTHTNFNDLIPG